MLYGENRKTSFVIPIENWHDTQHLKEASETTSLDFPIVHNIFGTPMQPQ